jgi:hypothetical protein
VEGGSFELLAASLRADARDLDTFLEALATKLSAAFPDSTKVERKGFRGSGRVRAIDVELGEHRYRLEREPSGPSCSRARTVRGIVLKNDELGLDAWIDALAQDVSETAEQSERGRVALERLLHE